MSTVHPFVERLRNAGIVESDGEELRCRSRCFSLPPV
jgi:hypothetical protein